MRRALAERYNQKLSDPGAFNVENSQSNKAKETFVPKQGNPTEFRRPIWRARIEYKYQDRQVRGRAPMTQKQTIKTQDTFDKKLDRLQKEKLVAKPTELRRPIYKRPAAAGRPFEKNEALEARDLKKYGIKVDIGDSLTKAALNRDMPDPNDAPWLAEYNRRLALGESHEEIMKALPFGRPQRTIPFAVNLERITRQTAQTTVDAINEMSVRNLKAIRDNPAVVIESIRKLIPWIETMPRPKINGLAETLQEVYPRGAKTTWSEFGFPYQYLDYNDVVKWKDLVRMWTLLISSGINADIMTPFSIVYGGRIDPDNTYKIGDYEVPKLNVAVGYDTVSLTGALEQLKWRSGSTFWTRAYVLDLDTLEVMPIGIAIQRNWMLSKSGARPFDQVYSGLDTYDILESITKEPKLSAWHEASITGKIMPVSFLEPETYEEKKEVEEKKEEE